MMNLFSNSLAKMIDRSIDRSIEIPNVLYTHAKREERKKMNVGKY